MILFLIVLLFVSKDHWSSEITAKYGVNDNGEKIIVYSFVGGTSMTLRGNKIGKLMLFFAQHNFSRNKYKTRVIEQ